MRRILPLALTALMTALCVGEAQAQWRKTWDFTQGYSEKTKTNLNLDTENWAPNRYAEDGTTTGWKDAARLSGELTANGEVIEELRGLVFGTTGLSNSNNYLLDPTSIRMSRAGMQVTFPKLIGGQTITAVAKSANSTATNRGLISATEELEYVDGPENGICNGSGVEGSPADGLYTLVWKVRDDVVDSIEVTLEIVGGGVDIKSFMIDGGDEVDNSTKIAYVYDSTNPEWAEYNDVVSILSDVLPTRLPHQLVMLDVAGEDVQQNVTADSLQGFNVVVVSPYIAADNAYLQTIKEAIAYTPMLCLTPAYYTAWGYGSINATETNMLTIGGRAVNSPLFKPSDASTGSYIDENGQLEFLDASTPVTGYSAPEGSYFAADSILAYAGTTPAIHMHNMTRNAFMLLPYTADAVMTEIGADIVPNAIIMLNDTKREVGATGAPLVAQDYHHLYTTVSISTTTPNSTIYYTLDGSEPTLESTVYTEPFDIDQKDVTVKAIALGDGFLVSPVGEQTIDIYELAATPTIAVEQQSGLSIVTITPAQEGEVVYYNLINSTDSAFSTKYTEPLQLTKHCTISAFTGANHEIGVLQSENVSMDITVVDEKVRLDVVAHMDANSAEWNPAGGSPNYYTGRGGWAFYTEEIERTETYKDIYGQDSTVNYYVPRDSAIYVNPNNGWRLASYGQQALWQNTGVSHNVADFNGYNPETALDEDSEITNYCLQLSRVANTNGDGVRDPASASLQTTVAYQGPFDVVGYVSGHNAVVYVDVTTDTLNADGWQRLGQLNGGSIEGVADNGKSGNDRIWRKTIVSYDGTDNVYVRLMTDGSMANIFDVYIKNEGELSKDYITGISDITTGAGTAGKVVSSTVYSIGGARLSTMTKGINIVKEVMANGQVKARKVVVK